MINFKDFLPGGALLASGLLVAGLLLAGPASSTLPFPDGGATAQGGLAKPSARSAARPAAQPNIVVVMLDDMRADEMRFAPNARKYVRDRGIDFRNSFSPYPLCCPARASFLLGKYAHNHRVLYHDAPYGFGSLDDHRTVAGRLQAAGYQTAMVGKYLNKYGWQRSRVTGRPSQHYVPAGWTDWMAGLETRWKRGSGISGNTYNYYNFTQNINGRTVQHRGQYSSNVIGGEVRGLISKYHRSKKPFFLWVTPVAPHHGGPVERADPRPVRIATGRRMTFPTPARPQWVRGRFDKAIPRALGLPANGPSEANVRDKALPIRRLPEANPTERRALRDAERQRAEAIFAWDKQLGTIIARLKATGEYASTVLMFTSDNGFFDGEHRQRLGKIKAYEASLRVPLAVAGPGITRGVRYTPITTVDLAPTLIDLAGARPLPGTDGSSQVPTLYGPDPGWNTAVVTEGLLTNVRRVRGSGVPAGLTTSGLRTGRYKLIKYANGEAELYDLRRDPLELVSRWRDRDYAQVRRELVGLWAGYRSCRENACRLPLPADLRTDATWLAAQDQNTRTATTRYYGRPYD